MEGKKSNEGEDEGDGEEEEEKIEETEGADNEAQNRSFKELRGGREEDE